MITKKVLVEIMVTDLKRAELSKLTGNPIKAGLQLIFTVIITGTLDLATPPHPLPNPPPFSRI